MPKFMQLRLDPATGSALPPGAEGAVTQQLHIVNSMHGVRICVQCGRAVPVAWSPLACKLSCPSPPPTGVKPLVLRLRLTYATPGGQVVEQGEVSNFPTGW